MYFRLQAFFFWGLVLVPLDHIMSGILKILIIVPTCAIRIYRLERGQLAIIKYFENSCSGKNKHIYFCEKYCFSSSPPLSKFYLNRLFWFECSSNNMKVNTPSYLGTTIQISKQNFYSKECLPKLWKLMQ